MTYTYDRYGSTGSLYYPVGRLNNLVYPVGGGMEDWGYAASWDTHTLRGGDACNPHTFGGYDLDKTRYAVRVYKPF